MKGKRILLQAKIRIQNQSKHGLRQITDKQPRGDAPRPSGPGHGGSVKAAPDEFLLDEPLKPAGDGELSLRRHLTELTAQNRSVDQKVCFLGAGASIIPFRPSSIIWR